MPTDAHAIPTRRHGALHALMVSYGYVGIQFLITPLRIRVLTDILSKSEYYLFNLITMTIAFAAMLLSFGSLEYFIRQIPGAGTRERNSIIKQSTLGFFAILTVAALVAMPMMYRMQGHLQLGITLTPGDLVAVGLGMIFWGHLLQRHTLLLSLSRNFRYRCLQFLYAEAWFIPLVIIHFTHGLDHHKLLWIWSGWMILVSIATTPLLPYRAAFGKEQTRTHIWPAMIQFGLPLIPLIVGEQLFRLGDRYIIGIFHGAEPGAEYTVCMSIAMIAYTVGNNVLMIMVPVFNREKSRHDQLGELDHHKVPVLRMLFSRMLRYSWIFALVTVAAFGFCPEAFVHLLAAEKYWASAFLLRWAAPAAFFFITFAVLSRVLIAQDRTRLVGGITLAGAALNIGLNIVLVPRYIGVGAILSTTISLALMCGIAAVALKAWQWVDPKELHLPQQLLLLFLSSGMFWGLAQTPWAAFFQVAVGGAGCLVLMLGLRLFRFKELTSLTGGEDVS